MTHHAPLPDPRGLLNSLRARVLLAILVWVGLGIGGIWFSATRVFTKHIEEQYHEELDVHVRELAGLVKIGPGEHIELTRPLSDPRYLVPLSGFYWQVSVDRGMILRSASMTRGALDEDVAHGPVIVHRLDNGPTGPAITYGLIRKSPSGRDIHFVIATDQRLLDETIARFTRELTLWLLALAVALVATGLFIVVFGFRPLDRLAQATSRLRAGTTARLDGHYPVEIAPLVDDLNAYIAHNTAIVDRARVQAGNLAHALRTPLAVITDEAERLAQDGGTSASAAVLLEQTRLMAQQIEYQLARARSAAGSGAPGAISRLSDVLAPILSAMRRLHPDKRFDLVNHAGPEAAWPVDPVDLSELLSNLIDNAGKWSESRVQLVIGEDGSVRVIDDGPGLAVGDIARAFEIGSRFDPGKPGSGLGLAIAHDIATAYGLSLTLENRPSPAHGLIVQLRARGPTDP
ncbi:HAMP domain-containing histidine kinase [Novosphingobium sp. NBM11]|uniref:sensor histidine kinase n=1 Tax=Novosphingobium sp. NBM11 TaxID=2596914 RepID=UPI0018920EFB|nr:HAMP domain-containing sensor histidine kinase [Novosphingobium sp. NBM11]MBF5091796.1 HAMP domain-containing histidine kinase [Novosphingobium sp. NBM11]